MEDYGQLVDRENINREEAGVDASGMQAAIAALVVGDSTPEDRHPEKYAEILLKTVSLYTSCRPELQPGSWFLGWLN